MITTSKANNETQRREDMNSLTQKVAARLVKIGAFNNQEQAMKAAEKAAWAYYLKTPAKIAEAIQMAGA